MNSERFEIPIVLFVFKRVDTVERIIKRIKEIKPSKIYVLGDQGRDDAEKSIVKSARKAILELFDFDCEVICDFAEENRGVYQNIGLGAIRVFEKEKYAIFLEDDNLPEVSFFEYCKEMLYKYEADPNVLWICGTNYLGQYRPKDGSSYMFTSHILPCGWASWSSKFLKCYDKDLLLFDDLKLRKKISKSFFDKRLYRQSIEKINMEYYKKKRGLRYHSWDYHMMWSIRANSMFGISPSNNQIENIGIDDFSEHGFKKTTDWATKRLCGMKSYPLQFPLIHPKEITIDKRYEKKIERVLLYPWYSRLYSWARRVAIRLLRLDEDARVKNFLRKKRHKER